MEVNFQIYHHWRSKCVRKEEIMKYYVGIDIGTSSAKLTLINGEGDLIKESSREYRLMEPQAGWKEIDPETWMAAVAEAMRELLRGEDAAQVEAIGVTGQMHTVVVIGQDGRPLRPALMWNDTRTAGRVPEIKERIRQLPNVSYISNIISTGSPAMNLLWLKEQEPETFQKIRKFMIGPDYIVYQLTGSIQTDFCEASTSSLLDLKKGEWSEEIRQLLDFPAAIYPDIRGTNEIAGTVSKEWTAWFGFRPGVKVIVGTGDNPAAAIATGCFAGRYPVLSLGTSGVLMFPRETIDFDARGKNIMVSFDGEQMQILVQGVVQSCGSSMNWWMKDILQVKSFDKETAADTAHLGEGSLLFYPHLVGDKTIYADASLRGGFFGIGTETTRKEMTVAVMEGIAFGVRQLTEVMNIPKKALENLKITGGGSRNEVWMQIFANVLDVKVEQLSAGAGAGYGIALSAAAAMGRMSMEQMILRTVKTKKVFSPVQYNVKIYNKKYRTYLKIHDAMKQIFE